MIIDNEPTIDIDNSTIQVKSNIDTNEDVIISINGILSLFGDDINDITNDTITLNSNEDLYSEDSITVIYTEL